MRVALADIVFDAGTQIRAAINEQVVAEYSERMTEGVVFPAVVLFHDGNAHYLADGFHRFMAARRNEYRDIDADVRAGTKTDAIWFALGANKANGHRLTAADKKNAVALAFRNWPYRSMHQIAEQIGCSYQYVQQERPKVASTCQLPGRVTGKDGKSYPATKTVPRSMPDRSPAAAKQRRQDVSDMAGRGYTSRQIAASLQITQQSVAEIAKSEGISIHADRVVGKAKHHDANRIVGRMVQDAENLCADVNLIDFDDLDAAHLPQWLSSLQKSRDALGGFIRRLMKEQQKHGEEAASVAS